MFLCQVDIVGYLFCEDTSLSLVHQSVKTIERIEDRYKLSFLFHPRKSPL